VTVFRLRETMEALAGNRQLVRPPSLRSVAERAGLSYTTAWAIYHNKAARVDLATLDALATALGCEPGDLIGRRSSRRPGRVGRRG